MGRRRAGRRWCTIAVAIARTRRPLGRVSRRARLGRVGRLLGRVSRRRRVDGRKGTRRTAVSRGGRTEAAWRSIRV